MAILVADFKLKYLYRVPLKFLEKLYFLLATMTEASDKMHFTLF